MSRSEVNCGLVKVVNNVPIVADGRTADILENEALLTAHGLEKP